MLANSPEQIKITLNGDENKEKTEKVAVVGSRSRVNINFGHFTLLFCREWQRNVQKCNPRPERLFLLIKPIVLWRSRCRSRCRSQCVSSVLVNGNENAARNQNAIEVHQILLSIFS